jgi:hypothetical protein
LYNRDGRERNKTLPVSDDERGPKPEVTNYQIDFPKKKMRKIQK